MPRNHSYMSLAHLGMDYTFLSDYVFCQEGFDHLRGKRELCNPSFSIPLLVIDRKFDSRYPLP